MAALVIWDELAYEDFTRNPEGEVGREIMDRCADVVLAGAKARAEHRTGRMRAEMLTAAGADPFSQYRDVISPVRSLSRGFPYATVHEGRRVRDRRPHRSLKPALNDIRKVLS